MMESFVLLRVLCLDMDASVCHPVSVATGVYGFLYLTPTTSLNHLPYLPGARKLQQQQKLHKRQQMRNSVSENDNGDTTPTITTTTTADDKHHYPCSMKTLLFLLQHVLVGVSATQNSKGAVR